MVSLRGRSKSMRDVSRKEKKVRRKRVNYNLDSLSRALVSLIFLFRLALLSFLAFTC